MPKLDTIKAMRRRDEDVGSQLSYTSDILRKKQKIFGVNSSTLNIAFGGSKPSSSNGGNRSLTLAPSTFKSPKEIFDRSIKHHRESYKIGGIGKEKGFDMINDQNYHRQNDLNTLTYNSISGRYY